MKFLLNKIAAVLAFIIGAMAIFAGGKVLLGVLPDYYVISWLPPYNFLLGVISAFFAAALIWKNHPFAMPSALAIFSSHAVVMLILQTAYRHVVAPDSVAAMTARLATWLAILALLTYNRLAQARRRM